MVVLIGFPHCHPLRILKEGMSQPRQRAILGTRPTLLLTSALLHALEMICNHSLSLSSNSQSNSHGVLRISSLGLETMVYSGAHQCFFQYDICHFQDSTWLFSLTLFFECIGLSGATIGLIGSDSTSMTLRLSLDSLWWANESLFSLTTKET